MKRRFLVKETNFEMADSGPHSGSTSAGCAFHLVLAECGVRETCATAWVVTYLNPNGIAPQSPGLRRQSLPGVGPKSSLLFSSSGSARWNAPNQMMKIGFSLMLYTQGDGLAAWPWATGLPLLQSSGMAVRDLLLYAQRLTGQMQFHMPT